MLAAMALTLIASPGFADEPTYCWKDTIPRGVGTVPGKCPEGKEMVGLFCYDKCPTTDFYGGPGMKRVGIDCHSICPAGMADQGLFCRASEVSRAGFPWKFGDSLDLSGAVSRCEAENGGGKCEKWGAIIYPKCKEGYTSLGCCTCRPAVPDCERLGLNKNGQVDLSCAKAIKIASAPKIGVCGEGEEEDAGLCYKTCPAGYYGVGPVCWKSSPLSWVDCGMGAASTQAQCAIVTSNQVYTVGLLALNVATFGTSLVGTKVATGAESASKFAYLKENYDRLLALYAQAKASYPRLEQAEQLVLKGSTALQVHTAANTALDIFTEADITRLAAQIAQIVDPSGASGVVAAYTYPKCSQLFPDQSKQWFRLNTERGSDKLAMIGGDVEMSPPFPDDQKSQEMLRNESWRIELQSDGAALLKSASRDPGVCLGINPANDSKNYAQFQPCSDDRLATAWDGQHWRLVQAGDWTQLKSFSDDEKCLGLIIASGGPGSPQHLYPVLQKCGPTENPQAILGQHWKIRLSPFKGPGAGGWAP